MRNAILSILIFIFTMICVYFLNNSIINLCDNLVEKTESIELKIKTDEMDTAYNDSLELLNVIQEKNIITSLYLSHQEFDNLLNEAVKLSTYLVNDDEAEAHASLHLVKYSSDHIKKLQIPSLENIF